MSFEATLQYRSKSPAPDRFSVSQKLDHKRPLNIESSLTLKDTFPEGILVDFAQAGHSASVAPSHIIRLLDHVHKVCAATVQGGSLKQQFVHRRVGKMHGEMQQWKRLVFWGRNKVTEVKVE